MPPRRSQRSKRPSAQALEALVSSPPQRVRRQSLVVDGSSSSSTQQPPAAPATDQPAVLPSPVMDQLVSRVTDEVTKRLQPLLSNLSSLAQQAQSPPLPSSTCRVTPCGTVQFCAVFWKPNPTSPRTCCHPRYSRGTCCSRWRPVSPSLPIR